MKYPYEISLLIDKVSEKELAVNFHSIGIETLEDYLRLIDTLDTMFYEQKLTFKETNEYFSDPINEDRRIIVLSVMNKKKENSKEPNSSIISANMSPAYKPTKELIDFLKHKQK